MITQQTAQSKRDIVPFIARMTRAGGSHGNSRFGPRPCRRPRPHGPIISAFMAPSCLVRRPLKSGEPALKVELRSRLGFFEGGGVRLLVIPGQITTCAVQQTGI